MKVYSNKTFAFKNKDDREEIAKIGFSTIDDSCAKDPYFDMARVDGDLQVIESVKESEKVEEFADVVSVLSKLNVETLKQLAVDKGLILDGGLKKAEIVDVLKGTVSLDEIAK